MSGFLKKVPYSARTLFISALFLAFPFVVFFGSKGVVVLLIMLSLGLVGFSFSNAKLNVYLQSFKEPAFILCLTFFSLSLASSLWSPDIAHGLKSSFRALMVMIFGFAALVLAQSIDDAEVKSILKVFVVTTLVLFLAFGVEGVLEGATLKEVFNSKRGFHTLYKGFALFPLLIWPLVIVISRRSAKTNWPILLFFLVAVSPIFYVSPMKASILAYAVSVFVFFVVFFWPNFTNVFKISVTVAGIIFPFVVLYLGNPEGWNDTICKLPGSWQHRTYIWHYAAESMIQKPWFGWGSGVSAHLNHNFNFYNCLGITEQGRLLDDPWYTDLLFHPHNAFLQVWLEMGLLGIATFSAFFLSVLKFGRKFFVDRLYFAGFNATLAAFTVIFSVSFGLWENWWLASLFWIGFIWVLLSRCQKIN